MRNKWIAIIIASLLGWMGGHRFYLGRIPSGIMYLLFSFTFIPSLLSIVDIISLLLTSDEDFDLKYNYTHLKKQLLQSQITASLEMTSIKQVPPPDDVSTKIRELDKLRQEGLINNQEFQEQKKRILAISIDEGCSNQQ